MNYIERRVSKTGPPNSSSSCLAVVALDASRRDYHDKKENTWQLYWVSQKFHGLKLQLGGRFDLTQVHFIQKQEVAWLVC